MGRKKKNKKKNEKKDGTPSQYQLTPKLISPPRAVPIAWRLDFLFGIRFLMGSIVGGLLGLPVAGILLAAFEPANSLHWISVFVGCLMGQSFALMITWRTAWMLRHGEAVQPTVLTSKNLGFTKTQSRNVEHGFFLYAGWDEIKEVIEYKAVEKELSLDLPNGRSHKFTLVTYPEAGPAYLVDPDNPKRFISVDSIWTKVRPGKDGQWPEVPLSAGRIIVTTVNSLLAVMPAVGLAWLLFKL